MIDKRVIKTRSEIQNAFMQLVAEKDISKISISDLTKKAKINRSTFYLHYNGLEDVMNDIDSIIENDITECLNNFDTNNADDSTTKIFMHMTNMLNNAPNLKKYILDSTASQQIISRLIDILVKKATQSILEIFPYLDENKILFPITFAASGILSCYVKWSHSESHTTIEELIRIISNITQDILKNIKLQF